MEKKQTALLLDGPMGTELQRLGSDTTLPLWSARALQENPDLVIAIHRSYIDAGADIIATNSFRTNRRTFVRAGMSVADAKRLTLKSVTLARQAIAESNSILLVAGSDAPIEDCYSPELVPSDDELRDEHREHCHWLMEGGCDLLLLETMNSLREAVCAAEAACDLGARFMISLVTGATGETTLGGETLQQAVDALDPFGPMAILTNCSSPDSVLRATEILGAVHDHRESTWIFGGYANSGSPDPVAGWNAVEEVPMDLFVEAARRMISLGAGVIGSCCGTMPAHTSALRRLADSHNPIAEAEDL